MSDVSQGRDWFLASDGKWYPPSLRTSNHLANVAPLRVMSWQGMQPPKVVQLLITDEALIVLPLGDSGTAVDIKLSDVTDLRVGGEGRVYVGPKLMGFGFDGMLAATIANHRAARKPRNWRTSATLVLASRTVSALMQDDTRSPDELFVALGRGISAWHDARSA